MVQPRALVAGGHPHIVVSDLDGSISDLKRANAMCAIMVVHAHGDNMNAIEAYVPLLSAVLGTAQTQPEPLLLNVGGFTDGDRAVFLAKEYAPARSARLDLIFLTSALRRERCKSCNGQALTRTGGSELQ